MIDSGMQPKPAIFASSRACIVTLPQQQLAFMPM